MTPKRKRMNAAYASPPESCPTISCPACRANELVQAYVWTMSHVSFAKGARCLVCRKRFPVSEKEFEALRQPVLGEPYQTFWDRYTYMKTTHMRGLHIVICFSGLLLGLAAGAILVNQFDEPLLVVIFFPITCAAWWFGRWVRPLGEQIPGKCPACHYDLRGCTGSRCPECGTPLRERSD